MRWLYSLVLCSSLTGCGAAEVAVEEGPTSTTCDLTVVVWSEHLQRAVPASGHLVSLSDDSRQVIDTRSDPARGQTLTLQPGQYQIRIDFRRVSAGTQKVEGEEVVYLEPGEKRSVRLVVTDRKDSRIGYHRRKNSPEASTPPLPLELTPG